MNLKSLERRLLKIANSSAEESVIRKLLSYDRRPVEYAVDYLGKKLTPKQVEILELLDKPPYRVLARSANSQGKCIHPDDRIPLADGSMVYARELVGRRFQLLTLVDGEPVAVDAYGSWDEVKPCYSVELESGEVIRRTGNHPVWAGFRDRKKKLDATAGDWCKVADLSLNHLLAVPVRRNHTSVETLTDAEVKLVAYFIACGYHSSGQFWLGAVNDRCLVDASAAADELGYAITSTTNPNVHGIVPKLNLATNPTPRPPRVKTFAARFGLWQCRSADRRVPQEVFRSPLRQQAIFLSRLFAANGWLFTGKKLNHFEIGYTSASEILCRDVQELLSRFGVRSGITRQPTCWVCRVLSASDVFAFQERIGVFGREDKVQQIVDQAANRTKIKNKWKYVKAPAGCRWERIQSVTQGEVTPTVAITVPGHQTLISCVWEHNTYVSALKCCHFFDTKRPSITLATAPSAKSVTDLLFKEIRRLRPGDPQLSPKAPRLQSSAEHYVDGYTSASADGFKGRHAEHLGIMFDEATGIKPEYWDAADTMHESNGNHWWLAAFNPGDTSSRAYLAECSNTWHVVELSALEHPNVLAGLRRDPPPFPGAVTLENVLRKMATDCEEVTDPDPVLDFLFGGVWWRPKSVEFESTVLGRWPTLPTTSLFSPVAIDRCFTSRREIDPARQIAVGCDVARFGDDRTAICVRSGLSVILLELHSGRNSTWIAERLREVVNQVVRDLGLPVSVAREIPVYVDDTGGYGCGVVDQAEGYRFVGVNNSRVSPDPTKYPNTRTYLFCTLALIVNEILNSGNGPDLSRLSTTDQQKLKQELTSVRYALDSQNRRTIDPKKVIKSRLKRSPDAADALTLAFYQEPTLLF